MAGTKESVRVCLRTKPERAGGDQEGASRYSPPFLVTGIRFGLASREPIFHAVTPALDGNDFSMVQQAIQQRGRQHLIAQEGSPLREAGVTRQQNGAVFVAIAN